ncbi:MAG TPA: indole-3-glycerol phosphate synthase TrpC [Pyrinomonadaceae bacterium]|jgi:indole-3-glycerol phosphate synthase|nr:indole-3-glycerol phosphate synthase TrpC [Pyrinomonadaceae bacterium]
MTFLETIIAAKRKRLDKAEASSSIAGPRERALALRSKKEPHLFRKALQRQDRINIIAEIKRASPSKGIINDRIDVAEIAREYERGGAAAISVLTEEDFFKGSLKDLREASEATSLPILRKDFIIDESQIYEAAEAGADAILLIAAALDDGDLKKFINVAEDTLGLDVLLEVHDLDELERAKQLGAAIIGVNNRSLHSFEVSLDVSRELALNKSSDSLFISESGLSSTDEILELHELGFDAFLIGETLMRSSHAADKLSKLTAVQHAI